MSNPFMVKDSLVSVKIYADISDEEAPRILTDPEVSKLDPAHLPEHILAIESQWKRPNWTMATLISSNSYVDLPDGRQRFDVTKWQMARIRCLLVDWTFKDKYPEMALVHVNPPEAPSIQMLSNESMAMLGKIHPSVLEFIYNLAMNKIYPDRAAALGEQPAPTELAVEQPPQEEKSGN